MSERRANAEAEAQGEAEAEAKAKGTIVSMKGKPAGDLMALACPC